MLGVPLALAARVGEAALAADAATDGAADAAVEDAALAAADGAVAAAAAASAAEAGAALAMSGAIFQGLVRNPLVSPDIIGIDAGATVFAVFWIVTGRPLAWLPVGAFTGAILAAAVIYALTWRGGIVANRLILVGIGVGAALSAATTFLTVRFPIDRVRSALFWSTGSVYGTNWQNVRVLVVALIVLTPCAIALTWALRTLGLGDDAARGLGMPLERTRLGLIVVGCALSAVTVAVAGPIGFVALMVPHIARMLGGSLAGSTMLFTGILGASSSSWPT